METNWLFIDSGRGVGKMMHRCGVSNLKWLMTPVKFTESNSKVCLNRLYLRNGDVNMRYYRKILQVFRFRTGTSITTANTSLVPSWCVQGRYCLCRKARRRYLLRYPYHRGTGKVQQVRSRCCPRRR